MGCQQHKEHLSEGCCNTLLVLGEKRALRPQERRWPGQEAECRQPGWGWDHVKKPSEAKPVSGERFWLGRNRITDKETVISMILNTPLNYTRNRFTLERASTKDKHQTAGKMHKSPSPFVGRWRCLVNPLHSCLGYQERRKKGKAPKVSVNIYLLG